MERAQVGHGRVPGTRSGQLPEFAAVAGWVTPCANRTAAHGPSPPAHGCPPAVASSPAPALLWPLPTGRTTCSLLPTGLPAAPVWEIGPVSHELFSGGGASLFRDCSATLHRGFGRLVVLLLTSWILAQKAAVATEQAGARVDPLSPYPVLRPSPQALSLPSPRGEQGQISSTGGRAPMWDHLDGA